MASRLPAARHCALDVLQDVLDRGCPLQEALDQRLTSPRTRAAFEADPRERALATVLCYGTLRHLGRIQALLGRFLRKPGKLPPKGLRILQVASFELLFLQRIPSYATLDWAVRAMKQLAGTRLGGLATAVLRQVDDIGPSHHDFSTYYQKRSFAQAASAYYSLPLWMVEHLLAEHGREHAKHYMEAAIHEPPLGLRINRTKAGHEAVFMTLQSLDACLRADFPGVMLHPDHDFSVQALLAKGMISRQSMAGQEALQALAPDDWPTPVWDACAGHGGKTLWLAECGYGPLWASDLQGVRLRGLESDCARLSLPRIPVFRASAAGPSPLRTPPRTILLDAPCSGLGVLSRRPDSKWRRQPDDITQLSALQSRMLEHAWSLLPSGGLLAYITCTITQAENADQIDAFLAVHQDAAQITRFLTPPASLTREFFFASLLRKA